MNTLETYMNNFDTATANAQSKVISSVEEVANFENIIQLVNLMKLAGVDQNRRNKLRSIFHQVFPKIQSLPDYQVRLAVKGDFLSLGYEEAKEILVTNPADASMSDRDDNTVIFKWMTGVFCFGIGYLCSRFQKRT